ncbi:hypothetical protein B0H66DRAFT_467189 [Apodospora peruviana]|uniref:NACHT domain-containing protein n=1 Tax=Apodospora peruviana TaxID=516989 RepID=A0AAE0ITE8_9PEZI|nr:hypothetical protein B0H66DRAFT_467189 [Apodospora peruviana]
MPLKAPAAAQSAGRRTIQNAFQDLESAISPAHSRDFASTTFEDVRKAAIDIEHQLAARQSLRNMRRLEPPFCGLEHYSKVIEVLCNGTDYLPWIWAPIKLILKYIEAFERLIKTYARIAESLGRFQLWEASFKGKPQLYPSFAIFYSDILQFHKSAYNFVTRRCWKILFLTSWGRFQREFDNILDDLKRHEDLIDKDANAHKIIEAREMRKDLELWKSQSLDKLAQEQREKTARQIQGVTTWLQLDDSEQISLLDSLTKVGFKYPGTVDWVLRNQKMASWLRSSPNSPLLWLQGGPGTGKSVITARLLAFLESSKSSIVVRHFCSYSHSSSTSYHQIIKSLLLQCIRGDGDLVAHVYEDYVGSKQATVPLLEKLLETAIEVLSSNTQGRHAMHIILDGLDECPEDKQRRLIRFMDRLTAAGAGCKVLISSRDTASLQSNLRRRATLSLADEKASLTGAITTFANSRLWAMHGRLEQIGISEETMKALATRIGVNYDKIMSRILSDLDSRSIVRLKAMFGWVAFSRRQLKKFELQSALLFHSDEPVESRAVPSYMLEACKPVVEERRNCALTFIHVSVKDYLQSDACSKSVRIAQLATLWENGLASLRCLQAAFNAFDPHFSRPNCELQVLRGVWGFILYASEFWSVDLRTMVSIPAKDWDPRFWAIATQLSDSLTRSRPGHDGECTEQLIEDLESIRCLPGLWYDATISLQARSERRLLPRQDRGPEGLLTALKPIHIHDLPGKYEAAVQRLISIQTHPDMTASELEQFREIFGSHAYPCRFSSCSHSVGGFKTDQERVGYEIMHAPRHFCAEQGCQYPPFGSSRALKRHHSVCHQRTEERLKLKKELSAITRTTNRQQRPQQVDLRLGQKLTPQRAAQMRLQPPGLGQYFQKE